MGIDVPYLFLCHGREIRQKFGDFQNGNSLGLSVLNV